MQCGTLRQDAINKTKHSTGRALRARLPLSHASPTSVGHVSARSWSADRRRDGRSRGFIACGPKLLKLARARAGWETPSQAPTNPATAGGGEEGKRKWAWPEEKVEKRGIGAGFRSGGAELAERERGGGAGKRGPGAWAASGQPEALHAPRSASWPAQSVAGAPHDERVMMSPVGASASTPWQSSKVHSPTNRGRSSATCLAKSWGGKGTLAGALGRVGCAKNKTSCWSEKKDQTGGLEVPHDASEEDRECRKPEGQTDNEAHWSVVAAVRLQGLSGRQGCLRGNRLDDADSRRSDDSDRRQPAGFQRSVQLLFCHPCCSCLSRRHRRVSDRDVDRKALGLPTRVHWHGATALRVLLAHNAHAVHNHTGSLDLRRLGDSCLEGTFVEVRHIALERHRQLNAVLHSTSTWRDRCLRVPAGIRGRGRRGEERRGA
eukprot:3757004-Rhodomonas_salina.2